MVVLLLGLEKNKTWNVTEIKIRNLTATNEIINVSIITMIKLSRAPNSFSN
jgi:hypothetical protein